MKQKTKMAESFTEIHSPEQKQYTNSIHFPLILTPTLNSSSLIDAIKSHKTWLQSQLHSAGAILFRGFPLSTATDFNDVVEAFGFDELPYVGGAAPRSNVVGRVFTANESPPHQKIPFHHEMAQVFTFFSFFYTPILVVTV